MPEESIPTPATPKKHPIRVLALGDSYTKGESVKWPQNFPNQLVDSLRKDGNDIGRLKVVAETGWRTDQLQASLNMQASSLTDSTFDLVTLCIGVNNQYQHADFQRYKTEFEALLQYAIARADGKENQVVVFSIPDWAYTPFGQSWGNPANTSTEIDQYNLANRQIAESHKVLYINVTDISREGLSVPDLVAFDGLHPAAQQYTVWVQLALPEIRKFLKP